MGRAFWGNFDFEYELSGSSAAQLRPGVASAMSSAWLAVAGPDDLILIEPPERGAPWSVKDLPDFAANGIALPRLCAPADARRALTARGRGNLPCLLEEGAYELVPWGCGPRAARLAKELKMRYEAPPIEVVRQVNSRVFRCELERELNVADPRMATARSMEELEAILKAFTGGWILKANHGMAGREAVRGRGPRLGAAAGGWARRRLRATGAIVVEPWLEIIAEAGLQYEIPRTGAPWLRGIAPQLTAGGTYRGSRLDDESQTHAEWAGAAETGLRVAARLQQLGYFGPLGIDSCLYRAPDGQARLRALQDLNARHTMGRLALGWRRLLPTTWCGAWLHLPMTGTTAIDRVRSAAREIDRVHREHARALVTSLARSQIPARSAVTVLVAADCPDRRASCEALLLNRCARA
jgi:hypothetical protein